jgi:hypothetical protein
MVYRPISRQQLWNTTTAIARQQILNNQQVNYTNRGTVGNCVFYSVRAKGLYNEHISQATVIPCGGRVQYLHRSPTSRRRQQKGDPVPGGITGSPCSWGTYIQGSGPPEWGSLDFETVKCGHESHRTWIWELRWQGPAVIVNDIPILLSERMLHNDYDQKCSAGK